MCSKTLLFSLVVFLASCAGSKQTIDYRSAIFSKAELETKNQLELRDELIIAASKQCGRPYNYGGKKPHTGFDCSGFVTYVYNSAGISARGASYQIAERGQYKALSDVEPGDLLFFGHNDKVTHVAMLYSNQHSRLKVIHSTKSRGVVIDDITHSRYWKQRYLFSKDIVGLISENDWAYGD